MTLPQREHPEAVAEFDAVRWYEAQEPGIGLALIDRAQQARQTITDWPNAAPPFTTADDGTVLRSKGIPGYPYRVIYTVEPGRHSDPRLRARTPRTRLPAPPAERLNRTGQGFSRALEILPGDRSPQPGQLVVADEDRQRLVRRLPLAEPTSRSCNTIPVLH